MKEDVVKIIIEVFKEQKIDLVVTLPEEPTYPLTETVRRDPYFTSVTAAGEGNGLALCAGASIGGRGTVFITGVAGLLVGTWTLAQMGVLYNIPLFILASYRGDIGDRSGISGAQLQMFQQVGEPVLNALRIPYRVVDQKATLKRKLEDGYFACRDYSTPLVLLLSGEVLW